MPVILAFLEFYSFLKKLDNLRKIVNLKRCFVSVVPLKYIRGGVKE